MDGLTLAPADRGLDQAALPWREARAPQLRLTLYAVGLLFFGYLFPSELAFKVGAVLNGHRLTLLASFLIAAIAVPRKFVDRNYVFCLSDLFALALAFWCPLAVAMSGGIKSVASQLATTGLEFWFSYVIGRVLVGSVPALRAAAEVMFVIVILLLILGFVDLAAGENILARLAASVSGNFRSVKFYGAETDAVLAYTTQYRFGLPRVRGPIEHSILYGGMFAMMAPVLFYSLQGTAKKMTAIAVCSVGVSISLSSAPILVYLFFLGIASYDALFRNLRWRWTFLWITGSGILAFILATVTDPVQALVEGFTLDPATGFTRILIWQWVGKSLGVSPIFGVGDSDWTRRADMLSSIDSLWLNHTLKYGYVGLALLLLTLAGVYFVLTPRPLRKYRNSAYSVVETALNISILQALLLAFTVDIWGTPWSLLGFILGIRAAFSEAIYLPPERRDGI